jgi:putative membrane protein
MMYYNGFYEPFHFLFSVISWILIIFLVLWVVRTFRRDGRHHMHLRGPGGIFHDAGMDILRERFAKGEISKEEYEEKKKVLMHE